MEKVQRMTEQPRPERLTADFVTKFRDACNKKGLDPQDVAKQADVDLHNLTDSSMPKLRDAFKKMQAKPAEPVKNEAFVQQIQAVFPTATEKEPEIKDPDAKASNAQIGKLRAMLLANGIGERPKQTETIADIIHRPINKLDMLTKGEANKAIKALEARASRES